MARSLIFLRNIIFRPNPRITQSKNSYIRSFCSAGDSVAEESPETSEPQKPQSLNQIAGEVLSIISARPRWEKTLLSDFPSVNFIDPSFFHELLKQQKDAFISFRIFRWLTSIGFEPDKLTCGIVFDRLVEANAATTARSFLSSVDFVPEMASLESYIRCLCANGFLEEALSLFDHMKELAISPSLETLNSALLGAVSAQRTDILWMLYGDMVENGVGGDTDTVECLIQAFCIDNNLKEGLSLLYQVLQDGFVPSLATFNSLISGFCKEKAYHKASGLMHTMIAKDRLPDISTYKIIIFGLCKDGILNEAFRIFNDLKNRGYEPDLGTYTEVIALLCKRKQVRQAQNLCFEMIHKGVLLDARTYNALINWFYMAGDLGVAKRLYREMCCRGHKGTMWTYNIMVRILSLPGSADEVLDLFGDLVKKGIISDISRAKEMLEGQIETPKMGEDNKDS